MAVSGPSFSSSTSISFMMDSLLGEMLLHLNSLRKNHLSPLIPFNQIERIGKG